VAAVREIPARDGTGVVADVPESLAGVRQGSVPPTLVRALDAIRAPREKTAGDIGGGGALVPLLAARFGRVFGIDDSPATLARVRTTCRAAHVTFHRADLADLSAFRARFDVAVTVNAILTPDDDRLDRIFESLHAAIRPGGWLIGVFPAMESVLYRGFLVHECERAAAGASRVLEQRRHTLAQVADPRERRGQKFFHGFELRRRLRHAGFRRLRFGRVVHGWTDLPDIPDGFAGEPPTWDWLVRGEA